jgi:hypothetical protein
MNTHRCPDCNGSSSCARLAAAIVVAQLMRAAGLKVNPRPIEERDLFPPVPPAPPAS